MFWVPILWIIGIVISTCIVGEIIAAIVDKPRRVYREFKDKLVLAFYGAASSGKSSGAKAVYGIKPDSIHPIPGTTKNIYIWTLPEGLSIADTPGLQDTNSELVEKAKKFIDSTDIFIYVINAQGGINEKVKEDLYLLKAVRRPLLVVLNKIDTINKEQKQEFIDHQLKVANVSPNDFIPVAFDPFPEIYKKPQHINSVRKWIEDTVKEKGEDLIKDKRTAEIIDEDYKAG